IDELRAAVLTVHTRFHRASVGCTIAGIFRPNGVECISCGANTPGRLISDRWKAAYTQCAPCGGVYAKGKFCCICDKVYTEVEDHMLKCAECKGWVHAACDALDE
ncbi:hypothetical protein T484DRAFT_1868227, partial [Baffinella frigidus]